MTELTPAAKVLDAHLIRATDAQGLISCQGCGPAKPEVFDSEADYLNHIAEAVLLANGTATTTLPIVTENDHA